MEYRMLGDSDLNVSVIGFGAWGIGGSPFWSNEGDAVSSRAIMKSYDLGINLGTINKLIPFIPSGALGVFAKTR